MLLKTLFKKGPKSVSFKNKKCEMLIASKDVLIFITLLTKTNKNIKIKGDKVVLKISSDVESQEILDFFKAAGLIT